MRSSERRPRFAMRVLPLLAGVGVLIPAYLAAAPNGPGPEAATRHLFAAVQTNDFQAVQSSIAAGADVEARNPWGSTAADVAVDKGYFRIAHYLVSIRNFQRTKAEPARTAPAPLGADARATLTQAKPPAAASVPAAAPRPIAPAVSTPPVSVPKVPAPVAPATADRGPPAMPTSVGGGDPFDPSRPAYGAALPAAADKGS
jgi:hypothetical protein